MFRFLLLMILFLCSSTFGASYLDSLKGATQIWDAFLMSSEASANKDTLNYGGLDQANTGWNNSYQMNGAYLFGSNLGAKITAVTTAVNHQLDSIVVDFSQYVSLITTHKPHIKFVRAPDNWVEGTGTTGSASPTNGVSLKYKGNGTSWSGKAIVDGAVWNNFVTQSDATWDGYGTDFIRVATDPEMTLHRSGRFRANLTDCWLDSSAVGDTSMSFLIIDDYNYASDLSIAYHQRWGIRSTEHATATEQPVIYIYTSDLRTQDSTVVLVLSRVVSGGTVTDPVLKIEVWADSTGASIDTNRLSVLSDTTISGDTLFWCVDSATEDYIRLFTKFSGTLNAVDSLYVTARSNPSYRNCDSVFLWYEDFSTPAAELIGLTDSTSGLSYNFAVTKPTTTVDNAVRSTRDTLMGTTHPLIDFNLEVPEKTFVREYSNICKTGRGDYVLAVTGGYTTSENGSGERYDSVEDSMFAFQYRTSDFLTVETDGMIVCAGGIWDTLRMEDMYYLNTGDSLYLLYEDKQSGNTQGGDEVGLCVSTDDGETWEYRGIILDTLAGGDTSSTSSPVAWNVGSIYYTICESKNGSYVKDGTPVSTALGVMRLFKGSSFYSKTQVLWYSSNGDDQRVPFIPYLPSDTLQQIPMAHWEEGKNHFISASTDEGTTVYTIDSSGLAHDSLWTRVAHLSGVAGRDVWGNQDITYRERATNAAVQKYNGVYYTLDQAGNGNGKTTADSIKQMLFSPLLDFDTTGNPFRLNYYKKSLYGASGFLYAGTDDIFRVQVEPQSEISSVGIVSVDSFLTNVGIDIRYRLPYGGNNTSYQMLVGFGNASVLTSIFGTASTVYEGTTLASGYSFRLRPNLTGPAKLLQPAIQPATATETVIDSCFAYAPAYSTTNWNTISIGVVTDSIKFGFDGDLFHSYVFSGSAETAYKRVCVVSGSHIYTGRFGGVEIDRICAYPIVSGGISMNTVDRLWVATTSSNTDGSFWRRHLKSWNGGW